MENGVASGSLTIKENPETDSDNESVQKTRETEDLNRHFNKFQLLELDDNLDVDLDHESAEVDTESDHTDTEQEVNKQQQTKQSASSNKNAKRRRNKNKANKGFKGDLGNDCEFESLATSCVKDNQTGDEAATFKSNDSHFQLLKLDPRNLIPENELKRMFGKSVLKEERLKEQKSRYNHLGGLSTSSRSRFVSSAYHDTRIIQTNAGPKMELDDLFNQQPQATISDPKQQGKKRATKNDDGKKDKRSNAIIFSSNNLRPTYYKFVHDKSYQLAHSIFLEAANRGHTESIMELLGSYPMHADSLIQLSDMVRVSEDFKTASELVERALLIFEAGFHPKFNLSQANCRLSYKRPENRTFFITIFKHIIYTNRRGLRRTPLEYTKLLLSLDPENDPLFATLMLDFYAIRSEEYDYLIDFISKWQHLSKLPNMTFSLALAHFMKSRNAKKGKVICEQSLKLADELLQEALLSYPNFIIPLLETCSAEPDSALKRCKYFDYSIHGSKYNLVPESLDLLINLYVQRSNILWKNKTVLGWLEKNVSILVEKFANEELIDGDQLMEDWSSFRGPTPRNLLRHIVLSDLSVKIPPSAASKVVLDIDPFPPESIISYSTKQTSSTSRNSSHTGPSSLFEFSRLAIRSMLPSFNMDSGRSGSGATNSEALNGDSLRIRRFIQEAHNPNPVNEAGEHLDDLAAPFDLDSIQSVLSSLSNLLIGAQIGAEVAAANPDDQPDNNERAE